VQKVALPHRIGAILAYLRRQANPEEWRIFAGLSSLSTKMLYPT
jgi:hypothetical protein